MHKYFKLPSLNNLFNASFDSAQNYLIRFFFFLDIVSIPDVVRVYLIMSKAMFYRISFEFIGKKLP